MHTLAAWMHHTTLSGGQIAFLTWAVLVFGFWSFQIAISVAGWRGARPYPKARTRRRFAVLVAAHNEEAVIGELIRSFQQQTYPADCFDIYVSCDNCTDRTEQVAREHGAIALVRTDAKQRGKTWNVRWALAQIALDQYHGVVLMDADNVADPRFLDQINDQCEAEGEADAIQGYVDTKNPDDSWVTRAYALSYWHGNRFWQLARHNRGLSALLVGTGLMISTDCLRRVGWDPQSLVEDLEFSAKLILAGGRVLWNEHAVVYDEKPVGGVSSYKQRSRWMQGHYWVFWHYGWKSLGRFYSTRRWQYLDLFLYLLFPGKAAVTYSTVVVASAVLDLFGMTSQPSWYHNPLGQFYPIWWGLLQCTIMAIVSPSLRQGRLTFRYALSGITYVFYGVTWVPILLKSFVTARDQSQWTKTEHHRALSIHQVSREGGSD